MLSFCLRVLNMSHDFIINYSIFGKGAGADTSYKLPSTKFSS